MVRWRTPDRRSPTSWTSPTTPCGRTCGNAMTKLGARSPPTSSPRRSATARARLNQSSRCSSPSANEPTCSSRGSVFLALGERARVRCSRFVSTVTSPLSPRSSRLRPDARDEQGRASAHWVVPWRCRIPASTAARRSSSSRQRFVTRFGTVTSRHVSDSPPPNVAVARTSPDGLGGGRKSNGCPTQRHTRPGKRRGSGPRRVTGWRLLRLRGNAHRSVRTRIAEDVAGRRRWRRSAR